MFTTEETAGVVVGSRVGVSNFEVAKRTSFPKARGQTCVKVICTPSTINAKRQEENSSFSQLGAQNDSGGEYPNEIQSGKWKAMPDRECRNFYCPKLRNTHHSHTNTHLASKLVEV